MYVGADHLNGVCVITVTYGRRLWVIWIEIVPSGIGPFTIFKLPYKFILLHKAIFPSQMLFSVPIFFDYR